LGNVGGGVRARQEPLSDASKLTFGGIGLTIRISGKMPTVWHLGEYLLGPRVGIEWS